MITGGVGKTMLAVGLARRAAEAGHRTYFTNAADLAARCHRAAIEGRWATTMRFYAGPAALVIDELGYLPLPAEAASALFQVVNQRYLKTSIIMTTNRPITEWGQVLGDTSVAAALLDRLLHRSVVIDITGDSYRLRDHHAHRQPPPRPAPHHPEPRHPTVTQRGVTKSVTKPMTERAMRIEPPGRGPRPRSAGAPEPTDTQIPRRNRSPRRLKLTPPPSGEIR